MDDYDDYDGFDLDELIDDDQQGVGAGGGGPVANRTGTSKYGVAVMHDELEAMAALAESKEDVAAAQRQIAEMKEMEERKARQEAVLEAERAARKAEEARKRKAAEWRSSEHDDEKYVHESIPKSLQYFSVTQGNGTTSYLACASEPEREKALNEIKDVYQRRVTTKNREQSNVLTQNMQAYVDSLLAELEQDKEDGGVLESIPKSSFKPQTRLWVDIYAPKRYVDLLSPEPLNRASLEWLSGWQHAVFPKKYRLRAERRIAYLRRNGVGPDSRLSVGEQVMRWEVPPPPEQRILLLSGPPGFGKTTLAHVLAKQAGYRPVEINASDDRSEEALIRRVESATQMRSMFGADPRPNLLIIDEIDGALGGGDDGRHGSIRALLAIIQHSKKVAQRAYEKALDSFRSRGGKRAPAGGESKAVADKDVHSDASEDEGPRLLGMQQSGRKRGRGSGGSTKRKKKLPFINRPIICICNDLYAPALRPLRQEAQVVRFAAPDKEKLLSKLTVICRRERFPVERRALSLLIEQTGSDIRSCLHTLQFLHSRMADADGQCERLTPLVLREMNVAAKDFTTSRIDVWRAVFSALPQRNIGAMNKLYAHYDERQTAQQDKQQQLGQAERVDASMLTDNYEFSWGGYLHRFCPGGKLTRHTVARADGGYRGLWRQLLNLTSAGLAGRKKSSFRGGWSHGGAKLVKVKTREIEHLLRKNMGGLQGIVEGVHHFFPRMNYSDPAFCSTPDVCDHLAEIDLLMTHAYRTQHMGLAHYTLPFFCAVARTCSKRRIPVKLFVPSVMQTVRVRSRERRNLLSSVLNPKYTSSGVFAGVASAGGLARLGCTSNMVVPELMTPLLTILNPDIRGVNLQLLTKGERLRVQKLVGTMCDLELTYTAVKDVYMAGNRGSHELAPNLEVFTQFGSSEFADLGYVFEHERKLAWKKRQMGGLQRTTYSFPTDRRILQNVVREMLARCVRTEMARRREQYRLQRTLALEAEQQKASAGMDDRYLTPPSKRFCPEPAEGVVSPFQTPKQGSPFHKTGVIATPSPLQSKKQPESKDAARVKAEEEAARAAEMEKVPFFQRAILRKERDHTRQIKHARPVIVYKFNEGFTNAVKRPALVRDFLLV